LEKIGARIKDAAKRSLRGRFAALRENLFNKTPAFAWRSFAAPGESWGFAGILFYGKPLRNVNKLTCNCF
jgi:hypothetical protein